MDRYQRHSFENSDSGRESHRIAIAQKLRKPEKLLRTFWIRYYARQKVEGVFLILIFNFKLKYTEVYKKFLTNLQCILFPFLTYVLPDFFFIFSIFFELQWRVSLSYG